MSSKYILGFISVFVIQRSASQQAVDLGMPEMLIGMPDIAFLVWQRLFINA